MQQKGAFSTLKDLHPSEGNPSEAPISANRFTPISAGPSKCQVLRLSALLTKALTMGPKMTTHALYYYLRITFPIAQDICYTGLSREILWCNSGAFMRYFL